MRLFTCGKKGAETRGRPPAAAAASPAAPAAHLEQVPVEDLQPAAGAHVLAGRRRGRGGGGRRRADGRRGRGAGRRAGVLLLQAAGQRLPVGLRLRAQPGGREPRPRLGRPRPPPSPSPGPGALPAVPARLGPAGPGAPGAPGSPRPRLPWRGRAGRGSGRSPWAAAPAASPCGREREREAAAPCAGRARGTLYKPPQNNK